MNEVAAPTVLIVDDDTVTRLDIQDYLAEAGFVVHEADSGEAGLLAFEAAEPDLVLLDVTMPGMDGYEVCEILRATASGEHLPIVMLTGLDDAESVERAYSAGATDFVTKPLNCPLLIHRLRYLLRAGRTAEELRSSRESLNRLAFFDTVTGLANRALLTEHLERAIVRARRSDRPVALLFIDLDRFKLVNDSWGHGAGDDLLRLVARRFDECLRRSDVLVREPWRDAPTAGACPTSRDEQGHTLARLGGDEFVVLLDDLQRAEDAAVVAERLLEALSRPFALENTELYVTASIGISTYPSDGGDAATLMKRADTAMYATKRECRNGFQVFTRAMGEQAGVRLGVETRLRRALEREEFTIHYQPLVAAKGGQLLALEALVRWNEPERGLVGPGEFIDVAEETGLIVPLGAWVLEQACRDMRWIHETVLDGPVMSVNLSAAQLRHAGLMDCVGAALAESGLAPECLELELTESMLMGNTEQSLDLLHALRATGIGLSIDDFGTGYSSLSYLKRLPIQVLKIDRCFVSDLTNDPADAAIVRGTIQLAHSLGLIVVAEGVERREQVDLLQHYGCDRLQGFYFSRPLPLEELVGWIRTSQTAALPGRQAA